MRGGGVGRRKATSTSCGPSAVRPAPAKSSLTAISREPSGPTAVAMASSTTMGGAVSAEGAALAMLPPKVAMFRVWTEPTMPAPSARALYRSRTAGNESMAAMSTAAPTRSPCASSNSMPRSSGSACRLTMLPGWSPASFICTSRSVPPASSFTPSPRSLSSVTASSSDCGAKYWNRCMARGYCSVPLRVREGERGWLGAPT